MWKRNTKLPFSERMWGEVDCQYSKKENGSGSAKSILMHDACALTSDISITLVLWLEVTYLLTFHATVSDLWTDAPCSEAAQ